MNKKLTLEEIRKRELEINPNIDILWEFEKEAGISKKRKKRYLHCKCKIDNFEWDVEICSLLYDKRCCPKCSGHEKLTFEELKERLLIINPNIEVLEEIKKLIGNKRKYISTFIKCKCLIDGHIWSAINHSLLKGHGCPICGIRYNTEQRRLNLEEIKEKLKRINENIEILSNEYKNSKTKLECKCLVCGHVWQAKWDHLNDGHGCPECGKVRRRGENNPSWKGGITPLRQYLRDYIFKWKKDSMRESNYKCVITGQNFDVIHHLYGFDLILRETLKTLNIPVRCEINKYTRYELQQIENLCLELHKKYPLGVCLCEEEHKLFHSIYGYGNNTPEQFYEFKEMRLKDLKNRNK